MSLPDSSFSLTLCISILHQTKLKLLPVFVDQPCPGGLHQSPQRIWRPLPTLSLPKEKQAARVFVHSVLSRRGSYGLLVQITVSIPHQRARLCRTCWRSKTGQTDDSSLGSLGGGGALDAWINSLPGDKLRAGIFHLLDSAEQQGRLYGVYQPCQCLQLALPAKLCQNYQCSIEKVGVLDTRTNSSLP